MPVIKPHTGGIKSGAIEGDAWREVKGSEAGEDRKTSNITTCYHILGTGRRAMAGIGNSSMRPRHLEEVKAPRLAELDKIEAAIKDRMRREITHLQHRTLEIAAEERAGKRPLLNSENVRRQAEALTDRLELRLADIARQRDIAPLPPEICGAALVVPESLFEDDDTDTGVPDKARDSADALTRAEIETKAMQAVMAQERSLGFEPHDVSSENRGYDIESRDPKSGSLRFIEVKGRRADAHAITITRNEMLAALNAAESFILAAVLVESGFSCAPARRPRGSRSAPCSSI